MRTVLVVGALSVMLLASRIASAGPTTVAPSPAPVSSSAAQRPKSVPVPPIVSPVPLPDGLGAADPGPSLIERATSVEQATYPQLPSLRSPVIVPFAGTVERAARLVGVKDAFVGIRLEDAVAMALVRNTDIAVMQANRRIVRYQIVADNGAYDVRFSLSPSYTHAVIPPFSALLSGPNGGPVTEDILGATAGFSGLFPVGGGTYTLTFLGQRMTTDLAASGFDPYYPTSATLSVSQPVLRGRDIDATRRQLRTDQIMLDVDSDSTLVQAQTTIVNVANAYWNLLYDWQNLAVEEAALRQSQLQAESNARRVQRERAAASDVAEANAQVSTYQSQVSLAVENVQQQQLELKTLLLADTADPVWTANLVPLSPVEDLTSEPDVDQTVTLALRNRPELAEIVDRRRSAAVQIAYARDQLQPQLDVGLTVAPTGLAGVPTLLGQDSLLSGISQSTTAVNDLITIANAGLPAADKIPLLPTGNITVPPSLNGSFGSSVKSLVEGRYPAYQASLNLAVPIGNRTARGEFDEAVEQDRALQVQQFAVIRNIKQDAATAVQMLRTGAAVLASARDQRQASQAVYLSELRRRAVGKSTTFLVLQRLVALVNARGEELQAQSNYSKAVAFYREASGQLLGQAGVVVRRLGVKTLDATTGPPPVTRVPNP